MPTLYPIVKDLTSVNHGGWGNTKEWITIHFVGAAGQARDNANYFRSTYREASAQYFIDPTTIIQTVEDDQIAWHIGDGYYSGKGSYNGYIGYGATNYKTHPPDLMPMSGKSTLKLMSKHCC